MDRTAIVFGGSGFIGTHLIHELEKKGEFSRIISADLRPHPTIRGDVEYITCDVREPIANIGGSLANAEIFNFAAVHTTPGHQDWEYFWTNIKGAIEVCNFAARIGAKRIFFTSSISIYGPSETELSEEGPFRPDSAYGRSKLLAEKIHQQWKSASPDRKLAVVRPAVIFGPGENGNFTRLAKSLKSRRFAFPARKTTIKSCAYVGELVRSLMYVRSLELDEIIYNLAYPERYTIDDICMALSEIAGYRPPKIVIPLWAMLTIGCLFEQLGYFGIRTSINRARMMKLVSSTNVIPSRLLDIGYRFGTDLRAGLLQWKADSDVKDFV